MLSFPLAHGVDRSVGGFWKDLVGHSKLQGSLLQRGGDSTVLDCTTWKQDSKPGGGPGLTF